MFKKIKAFLILVLVVPFGFMFTACKNNKGKDGDDNKKPPVVNPGEGGQDTPDPNQPEVVLEHFTVEVDYNFPERFAFLANNIEVQKQTNETYTLPEIAEGYREYFDCWCDADTDEPLTNTTLSGTKNEVVSVYAKWKDDALNFKRYYSQGGLSYTYDLANKKAVVSSCDETSKNVIIPQLCVYNDEVYSVSGIADNVFRNNNNLEIVATYANYLEIGVSAFENSSVKTFDMSTVAKLCDRSFANSKISSAIFGESFEEIGASVFENCSALSQIDMTEIDNPIRVIPDNTFNGCLQLVSVKLPETIEEIGDNAFKDCINLQSAEFLSSSEITTLGDNVFSGCVFLDNVVFGENITNIGNLIFSGCSGLKNLSVTVLPYTGLESSFSNHFGVLSNSLETLTITGSNVTSISANYFVGYSKLKTLVMNDSITSVGAYAFQGCTSLKNITFSASYNFNEFNRSAFEETKWFTDQDSFVVENKVLLLIPSNFSEETVNIPDGVETIAANVFASNAYIKVVNIPASVKFIETSAFMGCSSLETVVFEDGSNLKTIGVRAFNNCPELTSINLDDCTSLETIKSYALSVIGSIDELKLPASLSTIESYAFNASQIAKYTIDDSAANYATDAAGALYAINQSAEKVELVVYPSGSMAQVYTLPSTVHTVKSYAFMAAHNLKYVVIESGNVAFEANAFKNCFNKVNVINKGTQTGAGSTTSSVFNYLDDTNYTAIVGESIEFEFVSIPEVGKYYVEFVYESTTYKCLITVTSVEDETVTYTVKDVSNIL